MKKFITLKSIIILYIIPYIIIIALYSNKLIDTESKITLTSFGSGLGGLIAIIGLYFFYQRLEKQQKQIDIQIDQRVDERFNSAISLLGSSETSARTGAIYALYELAIEEEKYRSQIAQILCSHIRSKTDEAEYKKTHSKRPSNEIQTTIHLLFKEKGLYAQGFKGVVKPFKANLSHAYLMGADFTDAWCQGAIFYKAQCQGAGFWDTQFQGADFWDWDAQFDEGKELQLIGEIDDIAIKAIKDARPYLNNSWYEKMQKIIKENKGKDPKTVNIQNFLTKN